MENELRQGSLFTPANNGCINYGIFQEICDIRAHVSFKKKKRIYIFRPADAIRAIKKNQSELKLYEAGQKGVYGVTAVGYCVPPSYIDDLLEIEFDGCKYWDQYSEHLTTSQKGQLAVNIVLELIRAGKFPLQLKATEEKNLARQIEGRDVIAIGSFSIQVKCDAPAGETGRLFLQTMERNPKKLY